MAVGKLGFLLSVTMISAVVTSLIVNIHLFAVNNEMTVELSDLQTQMQGLQTQIQDLRTQIQDLQQKSDVQSQLYLINYEAAIHTVELGTDYVTIKGTIFNCGTDSVANVFLYIRIYDIENFLLKTEEVPLGTIAHKSYKNFETDIEVEGANSVTLYLGMLNLLGAINSNPSGWVNRTVVIEGKLSGPSCYIPEDHPPWNYELFGPDETIETIGTLETVAIGVLWNGRDQYAFEDVIVIGVVREGHFYSWGHTTVCYYIEAQKIVRF